MILHCYCSCTNICSLFHKWAAEYPLTLHTMWCHNVCCCWLGGLYSSYPVSTLGLKNWTYTIPFSRKPSQQRHIKPFQGNIQRLTGFNVFKLVTGKTDRCFRRAGSGLAAVSQVRGGLFREPQRATLNCLWEKGYLNRVKHQHYLKCHRNDEDTSLACTCVLAQRLEKLSWPGLKVTFNWCIPPSK